MVPRKLFPLLVILFLAGHYAPGSLPVLPHALAGLAAGLALGTFAGTLRTARVVLCASSALLGTAIVLPGTGAVSDAAGGAPPRGGIWDCAVTTTTVRGAMLECGGETFWASSRDLADTLRRSDSVTVLGSVDGRWMDVCVFHPRMSGRLHDRIRRRLSEIWEERIPSREASSLTEALLAGERGAVPRRVSDLFRETGTSHLLAVSGLHVSLVAAALFLALRRVAGASWTGAAALVLLIAVYVLLTGARASTLRAAAMFLLLLVAARRSGRPPDLLFAWAAAVVSVIVLAGPGALADRGAQMSFAAVLSLILIGRRFGGTPGALLSVIASGVIVTVCLAPLVGSVYGTVSLAAPFATLASMPFMLSVMLLGPIVLTWPPFAAPASLLLEWAVFLWLEVLGVLRLPSLVMEPGLLPAWGGSVALLWLVFRRGGFPARFPGGIRGPGRPSRPRLSGMPGGPGASLR